MLDAPAAHCLAYSPSGHLMATGGEGGAMQLWDPTTGVQVRALHLRFELEVEVLGRDSRL